ncbi:M23 family metallopeptidase [Mucilaginibacter paludis]|uniref:Peptidase M23 n=1 Tax=Mucilaginibacter paludis DSM 18603 TaxID=714943 RepID=H1Y0L0_9SPHI|nr:M23 family metallopeptidase [Mucilaginibacter paludis]EHQ28477.1 Peptidase M23 [Mucilaginibacter paludis DSM 18603]
MIIKHTIIYLLLILGLNLKTQAQDIVQTHQYPKDFFRYPLELPPTTAGSFGELRSNHFHSGLDFKTNQRTGYPVHAAFDGYISRLRIQYGGFGRAVYITHPNGFTTVYGHLERLAPELAKIVRDYQYQQQTYEADITLLPLQVQVIKGQVVAWSGNAGASAGPHVHFEIRDASTQETINPQLFGLTIPDKVPPTITALYAYHLNGNPFSEKTPKEYYPVAGSGANYHLTTPAIINLSGEIGFGISTFDRNSTSLNKNGAYSIQLKVDDKLVYTFAVERFAFDQTHAINAHIDFPAYLSTGREIQKSFILPGNKISVYPQSENRGIITFNDDAIHQVEYIVRDVAGNTSTLKFRVKSKPISEQILTDRPPGVLFKYDQKNEFAFDKVRVIIPQGNLYDDLYFNYAALPRKPGGHSPVYRIHNRFTPIHDSYELWIKPDSDMTAALADKAVIVSTSGVCEGGVYANGYIKASCRAFGDYYVRIDTLAPVITPLNITDGKNMTIAKSIMLKMSDNLSGVKSYNGKIDGKWVLMELDYKTKILSYTFDESIKTGKHVFTLAVADNKNNLSQFTANFYR